MSLLQVGRKSPEPGQPEIPPGVLATLCQALHKAVAESEGKILTPELIDEVAKANECERTHAWVAAGLDQVLEVETKSEILVGICVGQCQLQGSIKLLERFLDIRDQRNASGQPNYDILPRRCFDMCNRGPVVLCKTPDGTAGLMGLKPEEVGDTVAEIFEAVDA